jgi:hypothetical protein
MVVLKFILVPIVVLALILTIFAPTWIFIGLLYLAYGKGFWAILIVAGVGMFFLGPMQLILIGKGFVMG